MCECYADEIRREIAEQEALEEVIMPTIENMDLLHLTGWMIHSDSKLLNWLWLRMARYFYGREERRCK